MNARISISWLVTILLAGDAVALGFAQGEISPAQTAAATEVAVTTAPAPAVTVPPPAAAVSAVSGNAADQATAAARRLSPWYYEIERLTQAGVEDAVVLSYIYNSSGTFNLTAEQVIALKNLGASPQVLSAMMRHDRQLATGERPLTATATPPFPASVQAALEASLHPAGQPSEQAAAAAPAAPAPSEPIVASEDQSEADGNSFWVEPDYLPDPPQGPYPVRLPYPVKLSDPIIMLRLPSFRLPCW